MVSQKYVAEHHQTHKNYVRFWELHRRLLGFSALLALIFYFVVRQLAWRYLIVKIQLSYSNSRLNSNGIAYANYFLAILKGYRDASANALAIILGSVIGVIAYYLCYLVGGYEGALAG